MVIPNREVGGWAASKLVCDPQRPASGPGGQRAAGSTVMGTRVPTLSGETPKIERFPDQGSNPGLPGSVGSFSSMLNHSATRALNSLLHILHI